MQRLKAWGADVGVTVVLLLVTLGGMGPAGEDQLDWARELDVWAYLLAVLAIVPLVLRRRYPAAVLAANALAVSAYLAIGYPYGPIMFTILVAAYTVGSRLPLLSAARWVAAYWLVVFALTLVRHLGDSPDNAWNAIAFMTIGTLAAFAAPLAIGAALRTRRESERDVRAAMARRAVSEERLRMAQELHDSVGHGLAVIAMQAGVALHVLEKNPVKAREALMAIRDTSKESLDGLRAELQALRTPDDTDAPRRPAPGLAEADVLLERIRAGGIEVDAEIDVRDDALPPDVAVAAYRIMQESLTNVLRHSGASRAQVRVRRDGAELTVDVVDDGSGGTTRPGADGGGTGIAGMRSRAGAFGGTLDAGPGVGGGFAVRARIPIREVSVPGSAS